MIKVRLDHPAQISCHLPGVFHFQFFVSLLGTFSTGQPATESSAADDGNESAGGNRPYPWKTSPQEDLREARRLIKQHGYWRRKEELEDAEIVIFGAVQA